LATINGDPFKFRVAEPVFSIVNVMAEELEPES
jgi:hypothetical protein